MLCFVAPEHKFPSAHNDCIEATKWLHTNAESLGADGAKLGVFGDSAGGNLAAVMAQELADIVKISIPVYPVISFSHLFPSSVENSDGIVLSANTKMWFDLMHLGTGNYHLMQHPLLSPMNRINDVDPATFPRMHVITAELDLLRDDGEYYVQALLDRKVSVTHVRYNNTVHGFFGQTIFPHGKKALRDVTDLIKEFFA